MVKLFLRLSLFVFVCLLLGEALVRYFHLVIDVPQRTIDANGIQRFIPNQTGYWNKGKLKWTTNELGFAGCSDVDTTKETITIIGDSFIENFMNEDTCRQCNNLKKMAPQYNFIEGGRAGVSFLEGFMIAKAFEAFKPRLQVLYMSNHDVLESIQEIATYSDRMQYSIERKQVMKASIRGGMVKKILYNWKLMYYLYNRFPIFVEEQNKGQAPKDSEKSTTKFWSAKNLEMADVFLKYIKAEHLKPNYIVALHPDTETELIDILKKYEIPYIQLVQRGEKKITFESDSHWTCYGHSEMAKQVASYISQLPTE